MKSDVDTHTARLVTHRDTEDTISDVLYMYLIAILPKTGCARVSVHVIVSLQQGRFVLWKSFQLL